MKEDLINSILTSMLHCLDDVQLQRLKEQLRIKMSDYHVTRKSTELMLYGNSDLDLVRKFLEAKAAARKAVRTLKNYKDHIVQMIKVIGKRIIDIDEDDITMYLYRYQIERNVSKTTARNIRASLSSFFNWLRKTGRIDKNPMDLVEVIKQDERLKEVFTDEQIVKMRENCENKRDLALIDFLNSSMIRVGELQKLNRDDIEFDERECIVFGKGNKERIAYFDANTKLHLQEYLKERTDNNPALFVSLKRINGRYERLSIGAIQSIVRNLGKKCGFRVHPHKFRRSGATRNLEKGMDLYDLKDILGHTKIETTLIYVRKRRKLIKLSYERFNM